jgi:hypothetical protein
MKKAISSQFIHCRYSGDYQYGDDLNPVDVRVDALLVIFDDGTVEVRCPADCRDSEGDPGCIYGRRVDYRVKLSKEMIKRIDKMIELGGQEDPQP